MSKLTVTTITDSTNSIGTDVIVKATPKTTCSYRGTDTVQINDSVNVSSLVDIKTGDYRLNFVNNFSSTGYALKGNTQHHQDTSYPGLAFFYNAGADHSRFTGSSKQQILQSTQVDSPLLNFIAAGTLA